MRDFLRGFIGNLLSWGLGLFGIVILLNGFLNSNSLLIICGIVSLAIVAGIRYYLGHIARIR